MSDSAALIADATRRIFDELGRPNVLKDDRQRRAKLWSALEGSGLALAWVEEGFGGAGASLADGFDALRIAGEFAVNVPLAESLLAGWLLAQAKIPAPSGAMTLAPVDARDRITVGSNGELSGVARSVPFASDAKHLVAMVTKGSGVSVALLDAKHCRIDEVKNLAGDARDTVTFERVKPLAIADAFLSIEDAQLLGAAVRSVQMAGAMQAILDISVAYANERVAFEKPIAKFQAIQHNLARLAAEAAAAIAAASSAADAISSASRFDEAVFLEAASAKIRVGEAVTAGAAIAHQVHGAIGFSREHVLHCYTQRLAAWRDDFGSESEWALRLGRRVIRNGVDALWPMLAAR